MRSRGLPWQDAFAKSRRAVGILLVCKSPSISLLGAGEARCCVDIAMIGSVDVQEQVLRRVKDKGLVDFETFACRDFRR